MGDLWPPGTNNNVDGLAAAHNMLLAHAKVAEYLNNSTYVSSLYFLLSGGG